MLAVFGITKKILHFFEWAWWRRWAMQISNGLGYISICKYEIEIDLKKFPSESLKASARKFKTRRL